MLSLRVASTNRFYNILSTPIHLLLLNAFFLFLLRSVLPDNNCCKECVLCHRCCCCRLYSCSCYSFFVYSVMHRWLSLPGTSRWLRNTIETETHSDTVRLRLNWASSVENNLVTNAGDFRLLKNGISTSIAFRQFRQFPNKKRIWISYTTSSLHMMYRCELSMFIVMRLISLSSPEMKWLHKEFHLRMLVWTTMCEHILVFKLIETNGDEREWRTSH